MNNNPSTFFIHVNRLLFMLSVIILSYSQAQGQYSYANYHISYQLDSIFSWSKIDSWSTDLQRDNYLKKVYNNRYSGYCGNIIDEHHNDFEYFIKSRRDEIHLVDLDGDMDFDVIYDGYKCSGHETKTVEIFENVEGILVSRLDVSGHIDNVNLKRKEIIITRDPCCADVLNVIRQYIFSYDDILILEEQNCSLFITDPFSIVGEDQFPTTLDESKTIILSDSVVLRWSPDTLAREDSFVCRSNEQSNVISKYPAYSKGTILARTEDNLWLFVLMDNNIDVLNHCVIYDQDKRKKYKTYGWIMNVDVSKL